MFYLCLHHCGPDSRHHTHLSCLRGQDSSSIAFSMNQCESLREGEKRKNMKRIELKKKKRQNDILSHHFLTCPDCLCPSSCPSCSSPGAEKTSETSWLFRCYLFFSETCSFDRFCRMLLPKNLNENTFVTEHLWAYDSLKWSRIEGWSTINCTWEVLHCMFSFNRSTGRAPCHRRRSRHSSHRHRSRRSRQSRRSHHIRQSRHLPNTPNTSILKHIATYCDCVQLTSDCIKDIQGSHLTSTFWKKK